MICIDCGIDKEDKHFRRYTNKEGYLIQRRQCYSCLNIRQKARNQKKVSVIASNDEPEVLEVKGVTKKCEECEKILPVADYYKSSLGTLFKYCKICHVAKANKANKTTQLENGGSTRVPVKCNVFADHVQREQTHQFLQLLGWSYNGSIWFKNGIKDETGKWLIFNETPKKKRYPNYTGGRKVLAVHEKKDEVVKKFEDGMNCFELADIYNCSHTTIRKLIRDYNDERRGN
jgi:hypothetical protein